MDADSTCRACTRRVVRRPVALAVVLAAVLGLAGCGTQFLYNRLDTVLHLYVSTQVDLEEAQSRGLRRTLRELLDWHRRSELPRYAQFAESLARDAAAPLGRARIDDAQLEIEALWRDAAARGAPDLARWLAALQPRQLDELFASLGEDDGELRAKYCEAPEERRRRERLGSLVESIEDWVGRLDAAQRALVRERYARITPAGCGWVESRLRHRQALRALLGRGAAARPDDLATLADLMVRPEQLWDPDYRARFDANRTVIVDLLAELDATLDARQRRRLVRKLGGHAEDFRALAATPQVLPAAGAGAAR